VESLGKPSSLSVIILGFLFLAKLIFLYLGQKYSLKRGFKHTIWLSLVPFTIFIPLIILSESIFWLIPVSAIFWGAHGGLFWWGYHGYFVKSQKTGHYGQTIGLTLFVYTVASVVMPIFGALIIDQYGFKYIYALSYLLMLISLIILGRADDVSQKHDVTLGDLKNLLFKKKALLLTLATRGMSVESHGTFWQLYLFFLFGTVLDLGVIASVSALITSSLMVFVGKYIDKHGEQKTISLSSPVLALAWSLRFFITSVPTIVLTNAIGAFSGRSLSISVDEYTYKLAADGYSSPVLLLREIGLIFGVFASLATVGLLTFLGFDLKMLFVIVGLITLLPVLFLNIYGSKK